MRALTKLRQMDVPKEQAKKLFVQLLKDSSAFHQFSLSVHGKAKEFSAVVIAPNGFAFSYTFDKKTHTLFDPHTQKVISSHDPMIMGSYLLSYFGYESVSRQLGGEKVKQKPGKYLFVRGYGENRHSLASPTSLASPLQPTQIKISPVKKEAAPNTDA